MNTPRREWIEEFAPESDDKAHAPLLREIVVQERAGNWYDIFLTHPTRRVMTRLTLDECLGYLALAVVDGRPPRWTTPEQERDWRLRMYQEPPRVLEPWEKLLPERVGGR